MEIKTNEIYSEVYSVLNTLGDTYIKKIPIKLFNLIKDQKLDKYNPQYNLDLNLKDQNIKKQSLAMIALIHLNYWCESEEEKIELRKIFRTNEENHQKELKEKYNYDNMFKKHITNTETFKESENIEEKSLVVKEEKHSIFRTIIDKIKKFFKR